MTERIEFSRTGEETLLSVSEYYGVKPRSEAFEGDEFESRSATLKGYRSVYVGDLVMNYMLAWKGAYGVSDCDGIVSPAYAVFKIDDRVADRRFIHHHLRSNEMRSLFRSRSKGIIDSRLRLYPDAFLSMQIQLPDLDTQRAIAVFLDHETARIDQLIEKKERLVELLVEKRFTETSWLLTHGLDDAVTTKPSGLDWMEPIPKHWNWARMKNVCSRIIDCKNRTPPQIDEKGFFVVRTTCIRSGAFDRSGGYWTDKESFDEWTKRGVPITNDVLFTREAPVGEACLAPPDLKFCLGQRMMIYRHDHRKIAPGYIVATIYSSIGKSYIGSKTKGSTVGHLRVPEVYGFPCLVPPREEQDLILGELDRRVGRFDALQRSTDQSIAGLREFRAALITAAVTVQLDVATWSKRGDTDRRLDQIEKEMSGKEAQA